MERRRVRREEYTVGWVCAVPVELAAARRMLDEEHQALERNEHDDNLYHFGRIGGHNVVIVCLPAGFISTNPAAAGVTRMQASFKSMKFGLMVGTGGGVPSATADIRLGDVVISQPRQGHGGVIQYDFGKATPSGFQRTGFLNSPPRLLLNAVNNLNANHLLGMTKLQNHISNLDNLPGFTRKGAGEDVLFEATYDHELGPTCQLCDTSKRVDRQARPSEGPVIHYGTIASGNQVIRNAAERDRLSREFGGVLCFEMEAAGLMNNFPCLVIRGISDYADSHKNKQWQSYAAATAAACAKELLLVIPAAELSKARTVDETIRETIGWVPSLSLPCLPQFKTESMELSN